METHRFLYGILLFFQWLLISKAYAAPFPATGTSILTSPEKGLYFSVKGFQLGTAGTSWTPQEDLSLNRGEEGTSLRFVSAKMPTAQVHLKTDYLKADLSLEAYARRWMRDYSQLGLDVLGSRLFGLEGARGVVVDLVHPKKKMQMRQAVFLRRRNVVILTCSDQKDKFESSLAECNSLIKNFAWNEGPLPEGKPAPADP